MYEARKKGGNLKTKRSLAASKGELEPASMGVYFSLPWAWQEKGTLSPALLREGDAGQTVTSRVGRVEGASGFWQGTTRATGMADKPGSCM